MATIAKYHPAQPFSRGEGRADNGEWRKNMVLKMALIADLVLAMVLIANVVLAMILIEDVLTLLMMIEEYWYRNPKQPEYYNTCKQNAKPIQQHSSSSETQTGSHYHKMGHGLKASRTRPCRTPGIVQ